MAEELAAILYGIAFGAGARKPKGSSNRLPKGQDSSLRSSVSLLLDRSEDSLRAGI
jgi:hypothetical protein